MIHPSPKIFEKDFGLCKKKEKEIHALKHAKKKEIAQVSKKSQKGERGENHAKKEFIFHPPYPPHTHMCTS